MSDQYPTQPGPPGWTSPPPTPGGQAGWTQPPPSWSPPPGATTQQPTPPPTRPWYKRGWFLLLVGFVAGGIVANTGTDPQTTRTVTVTSIVERTVEVPATTTKAAAAPTTAPKPTAAPVATIEEGEWAVPAEVKPGTYRTTGGEGCYWARLSGFSGDGDDIIANGLPSGPGRVTIARTDKGFKTSGCDPWRKVG